MGWLRDLMLSRLPPIRSFDALAKLALARPDWPPTVRPQPRSLAALFSRFDREVGLEWLGEREQVRVVLADVLGCPLADLEAVAAAPSSGEAGTGRRMRLDDVPYGRALDLAHEPLCPGIPERVLRPATWRRLWWLAPSGSGRTLAGRWLAARSLATFVSGPTTADWTQGPAFVELSSPGDECPTWPSDRLCVAAPFAPGPGWEVVTAPPVTAYARELIDWVAKRLPVDGNFPSARIYAWLETGPLAEGWVDGLGTLLGLAGAIDQLGVREPEHLRARELARRFLTSRAAALERRGQGDGAWLRRHGWNLLQGLLRRTLTDAEAAWDVPRTLEQWMGLIPPEHQREVDLDWLRLSLGDDRSGLRRADVERAARRLPPGAYRIVRALREAGLLGVDANSDELRLRPRWLINVMLREVVNDLGQASPFEWGEALLRPHAASSLAEALLVRAEREDSGLIEDVLELEADHNPAHVAAVETVFAVVGVALLLGAEFSSDLLEALFSEQLRLAVCSAGKLPGPRIAHPTVPAGGLLAHPTWLLSAVALSEQLGPRATHSVLSPWVESRPPALLERLLDHALPGLSEKPRPPRWAKGALELIDRLRATVGRAGRAWHPLERPGGILEELEHDVLSWETIHGLDQHGPLVDLLAEVGEARGHPWPEVARAIWHAWEESGAELDDSPLLGANQPWATRLWQHVPVSVLRALLERHPHAVRLDHLDDPQWLGLFESPPASLSPLGQRVLWQAVPVDHWAAAWSALAPSDPEALASLWRKAPEWVLARARERWEKRDWDGLGLLRAVAPDDQTAAWAAIGEQQSAGAMPDEVVAELIVWLHGRVAGRVPGWRRAYGFLAELEQALERARRAQ